MVQFDTGSSSTGAAAGEIETLRAIVSVHIGMYSYCDPSDWTKDMWLAIKELRFKSGKVISIKLHDKVAAIQELNKRIGDTV